MRDLYLSHSSETTVSDVLSEPLRAWPRGNEHSPHQPKSGKYATVPGLISKAWSLSVGISMCRRCNTIFWMHNPQ